MPCENWPEIDDPEGLSRLRHGGGSRRASRSVADPIIEARVALMLHSIRNPKPRKPGGVYVIAWDDAGPVKIGWSAGEGGLERLSSLQLGNPYKLRVAAHVDCGLAGRGLEKRAHHHLAAFKLEGEWFDVSVAVALATVERELAATLAPEPTP